LFFTDDSSEGKVLEESVDPIENGIFQFEVFLKTVPTFLCKSETIVDPTIFMVSSEEMHLVGHLDLQSKEQTNGFQRVSPSVDVVSQEQVLVVVVDFDDILVLFTLRRPQVKETHQVLILSMDISENNDG
jgi:hypothetical protein